ncbi:uncharacterized protein CDAR_92771 [Caerostris darwini]|uniref:Uncharacterized protein n=1 Tax=Caerostris darwini TaxID=1538125 RepID=A0AAV4TNF2_9ARAC|nr:uncharacterized protein CDAR_92771 [Caerostris darwini]
MNYFPDNTPDHFRTKLAKPIALNGEWECCLTEATIPGKYFTIQTCYNDSYTIQREIDVAAETLFPEFDFSLYSEDHADFVTGFIANMKKIFIDPPLIFTLIKNNKKLKIELKRGLDWIVTAEKANQLLRLFNLDPNKDDITPRSPEGFLAVINYYTPNKQIFKNQEIKLVAREPILDHIQEIKFEEGDLFLDSKLADLGMSDYIKFTKSNEELIVTLRSNINIEFKRNLCPRLMDALNIIDDAYVVRGELLKMQFPYSQPAGSIKDESFRVIVYKIFPTTRKESRMTTFIIPSGMYQEAKNLFKEFKYIILRLTTDSRVGLHAPQNTLVTFGEKLKDLLGFDRRTFGQGDYKSEYAIELRAGITEVYVYCDIVSASLVGDSAASILKIIPVANEHNDQIVKYFSVPLYFRVKKQFFDVIEIEMRTSSGTPIKFISDSNTIEFLISGLGDAYFDLAHVFLNVQAKILKADGTAFTPNDLCGPINYLLNTMFSECHISLNDRQISSESNYAYKTYIQSTLFHSESSQKNFLRAGMFYKDTAEAFDDLDLAAAGKNLGLKQRLERVKNGKTFYMYGILHTDLGTQSRLLISGTTILVRLLKAKDEFSLLAKNGTYHLHIENISLFIRKCDVSSSILVGHEKWFKCLSRESK